MSFDAAFLYAFFLVFVRASAMMLSSPIFGAQSTPVNVRVLTTLSIAASLTAALQPKIGPVPQDLWTFAASIANEALAGLVIGCVLSLVFYGIQMAGSFLDFQIGLGSSQILNPITGVPVTVVGQMKFMLAVVIFMSMNGHHSMIAAFVRSYDAAPMMSMESMGLLQAQLIPLIGDMCILALQIAAPVAAVSVIVDAGLGIINKSVPQMPVTMVGMPGKIALGFIALSVALPVVVTGVQNGVDRSLEALNQGWFKTRRG